MNVKQLQATVAPRSDPDSVPHMTEDDADSIYEEESGEVIQAISNRRQLMADALEYSESKSVDAELDREDKQELSGEIQNSGEVSRNFEKQKPYLEMVPKRDPDRAPVGESDRVSAKENDGKLEAVNNGIVDADTFASDEEIVDVDSGVSSDDAPVSTGDQDEKTLNEVISVSPASKSTVQNCSGSKTDASVKNLTPDGPGNSRWCTTEISKDTRQYTSSQGISNANNMTKGGNTTNKFGGEERQQAATAFFGSIARASATFYKAAMQRGQRVEPSTDSTKGGASHGRENGSKSSGRRTSASIDSSDSLLSSEPAVIDVPSVVEEAEKAEKSCRGLIAMLEAQVATLNGAKAGYVDLAVLKPMTERTCKVIEREIVPLLRDNAKLKKRVDELNKELVETERRAGEEICEKEQVLITAKMSLAEAQGELMDLKHKLAVIKKQIADPELQAARNRADLRARLTSAEQSYAVASDSRRSAELTLNTRLQELAAETAATKKLEAGYKDMEGDWA